MHSEQGLQERRVMIHLSMGADEPVGKGVSKPGWEEDPIHQICLIQLFIGGYNVLDINKNR